MDTRHLNELHRHTARDPAAPWSAIHGIPPEVMAFYLARGRQLRAAAIRDAFSRLARGIGRAIRRVSRTVPSGALGPGAVDTDRAYGRPC